MENSLDLQACDLALFVDASATAPDPYEFKRVIPALRPDWTTHGLSPESLLQAYGTLGFGVAPPAFSLGVRGHVFELGEALSGQAMDNLESAWELVQRLLDNPCLGVWMGVGGAGMAPTQAPSTRSSAVV